MQRLQYVNYTQCDSQGLKCDTDPSSGGRYKRDETKDLPSGLSDVEIERAVLTERIRNGQLGIPCEADDQLSSGACNAGLSATYKAYTPTRGNPKASHFNKKCVYVPAGAPMPKGACLYNTPYPEHGYSVIHKDVPGDRGSSYGMVLTTTRVYRRDHLRPKTMCHRHPDKSGRSPEPGSKYLYCPVGTPISAGEILMQNFDYWLSQEHTPVHSGNVMVSVLKTKVLSGRIFGSRLQGKYEWTDSFSGLNHRDYDNEIATLEVSYTGGIHEPTSDYENPCFTMAGCATLPGAMEPGSGLGDPSTGLGALDQRSRCVQTLVTPAPVVTEKTYRADNFFLLFFSAFGGISSHAPSHTPSIRTPLKGGYDLVHDF